MKKFAILLLLFSSCRSTRVVETAHWQHDTITVEREAKLTVLERDSTDHMSAACVEVMEMDTAGRVRTITRVDYRDRIIAGRLKHKIQVVHDTIRAGSASKSRNVPQRDTTHRNSWQYTLPLMIAAVIIIVLLTKLPVGRRKC